MEKTMGGECTMRIESFWRRTLFGQMLLKGWDIRYRENRELILRTAGSQRLFQHDRLTLARDVDYQKATRLLCESLSWLSLR